MILLATFQWKDVMNKINATNAAFGLKEVSTSNLSKIRSKFSEYKVKKLGENFARCGTCDKLQELRKGVLAGSLSVLKWFRKLDKHLAIACAYRELYYANITCHKLVCISALQSCTIGWIMLRLPFMFSLTRPKNLMA